VFINFPLDQLKVTIFFLFLLRLIDFFQSFVSVLRDGNGAPIPDPRRGIPLLGDVNGRFLLPAGSLADQNSSPSGEAGEGAFSDSPSPIPVGIPEFVCLCI
jgi:hypothetical protein